MMNTILMNTGIQRSQALVVEVAVKIDNGVVPVADGNLLRDGRQLLADHIGEIVQRSEER